jgi:4-hydroxy-2-oxoheptanedioate aldolase
MSFVQRLRGGESLIGMWVVTGSGYCAEVCAGAGLDWLLIDCEHAPNEVTTVLPQLQAVAPYPTDVVVRVPAADPVAIKRYLDIGATTLMVPMIESAEQARAVVAATRYPPEGVRGVGAAFARASGWNRRSGYLATAHEDLGVIVQVESQAGLDALEDICSVPGIDGVFIGPADLAASLGHLGRPDDPDVLAAVEHAITTITARGVVAGVNAFAEPLARRYLEIGARFVLVGADVVLLARGSEDLAARYREAEPTTAAPPWPAPDRGTE